jgi:hypothetical protein
MPKLRAKAKLSEMARLTDMPEHWPTASGHDASSYREGFQFTAILAANGYRN